MTTDTAKKSTRPLRTKALVLTTAAVLTGSGAIAAAASTPSNAFTPARSNTHQGPMPDVAKYVLAAGAPGYVARIDNGRRVETTVAGLADTATGRKVTSRDQFEIGSNTKTFMSALTLQLVDRKQVDLDAPVAKYLPGVVPNGKNITVRMLLNHTSGLFSYTGDESFFSDMQKDPQHVYTEKELLAIAFKHDPNFAPGKGWSYSNTNYTLIGLILQKQTGKSLADLVQQRIARPLGLKHTYYPTPRATNTGPGYTHGYMIDFGAPERSYVDTATWPVGGWGGAAGAVISTPEDLSRFFSGVLGGKLFSQKQLNAMKTTVPVPADFGIKGSYGLGLFNIDSECGSVWGHGGDTMGHHSTALATENGRRIAVSDTNAEPSDTERNDGVNRFYDTAVAAQSVTVCEMLDKPVPASVTDLLHGTNQPTPSPSAVAAD